MTRGGKRNPAGGRPRSTAETKTANLCGVRVTPTELANIRQRAAQKNVPFGRFVRDVLAVDWPSAVDALRTISKIGDEKRSELAPRVALGEAVSVARSALAMIGAENYRLFGER